MRGVRLSLLPPENATGKYVKVVQRMPVKILVVPAALEETALRIGINVDAIPINVAAFAYIPKNNINNATGLINLGRNTGASVGVALATTLPARREQLHHNNLVSHLTPLDWRYQQTLDGIAQNMTQHGASASGADAQAPMMIARMVQQQAAMLSFADAFRLLGVICFIAAPFVSPIKKNQPRKGAAPVH